MKSVKLAQDELFRMDRNELKKIVRETEEKARGNGWNPNPGAGEPSGDMKRDGRLTGEEFARYQMAEAIVRNTVDLDDAAVSNLGGGAEIIQALREAREASYVCAPNGESAFGSRFDRIVNSIALRLLVNVERKCVVTDAKRFVATIESHVARSVEVEAADEDGARAEAERLAGESEFVGSVREETADGENG